MDLEEKAIYFKGFVEDQWRNVKTVIQKKIREQKKYYTSSCWTYHKNRTSLDLIKDQRKGARRVLNIAVLFSEDL